MRQRNTAGCGGCALAVLGMLPALIVWSMSRRTRRPLLGGFVDEGIDVSDAHRLRGRRLVLSAWAVHTWADPTPTTERFTGTAVSDLDQ